MSNNCKHVQKELNYLKRQFTALLIADHPKQSTFSSNVEMNLKRSGFAPKVIKTVARKISKSGRPMSDYSKRTGLLKKSS